MNKLVAATLAGLAVGAAGGLAGAPLAAGANCAATATLDGITAQHPHYMDGGVGAGWVGQGCRKDHGSKCAPCEAPTLAGMESECLKQWKAGYCP